MSTVHTSNSADLRRWRLIAPHWGFIPLDKDHDQGIAFTGATELDIQRCRQHGSRLTPEEQRMHLAVHECGHTLAMHAIGIPYGKITILPQAVVLDAQSGLGQFAKSERRDLPGTAYKAAMLTLSGLAAGTEWMRRTRDADGRILADDPLNLCEVHLGAVQDHFDLMCFPTPRPTYYLYGTVQPPEDWTGDVIEADAILQELNELIDHHWDQVLELASFVLSTGGASVEDIGRIFGDRS